MSIFDKTEESLKFPITIDARIIYTIDVEEKIIGNIYETLTPLGLCNAKITKPKPSTSKYGRLVCEVELADQASLHTFYTNIAAIDGVRSVL
jgi:putative lipoic acid-binding regulatory protein